MIVPDVNLLVYAYYSGDERHEVARCWWEEQVNGRRETGLAWGTILGFVRVMTHRRIFSSPLSIERARECVAQWLEHRSVRVIEPGPGHVDRLFGLLEHAGSAGNLVSDAHLAALAMEYRAELCTADRDFGRFPGLWWSNPIAP